MEPFFSRTEEGTRARLLLTILGYPRIIIITAKCDQVLGTVSDIKKVAYTNGSHAHVEYTKEQRKLMERLKIELYYKKKDKDRLENSLQNSKGKDRMILIFKDSYLEPTDLAHKIISMKSFHLIGFILPLLKVFLGFKLPQLEIDFTGKYFITPKGLRMPFSSLLSVPLSKLSCIVYYNGDHCGNSKVRKHYYNRLFHRREIRCYLNSVDNIG